MQDFFLTATNNETNLTNVIKFIHEFAPQESFPLSKDKISAMLTVIFGYVDDNLVEEFEESFVFVPKLLENSEYFVNQEINEMLQNDPFSKLSERILHNFPIMVETYFLDVE